MTAFTPLDSAKYRLWMDYCRRKGMENRRMYGITVYFSILTPKEISEGFGNTFYFC
jgi:hypothetical protein